MRSAAVTAGGDVIRWIELPGTDRPRVYLHGLGAASAAYFTATAVHPLLAGHRSLLVDLLGFGYSDRPTDFDYTLESHADTLAGALTAARVTGAEVIAHSMGGAVAIVLAARHPHLVSKLVLVDPNLDPLQPEPGPGSRGIAHQSEREFLDGGWQQTRDDCGPDWWATMRLAGRTALHRTAVNLVRGSQPTMRTLLLASDLPRTLLYPQVDGAPAGAEELTRSGVRLVAVPDCGHNIMLDNPDAFAESAAAALR